MRLRGGHVLFDIPRSGLFLGHTRTNAERYLAVEHFMLCSGFPKELIQPDENMHQANIASWARRLVAAVGIPWQDSLSHRGATTAALLPIDAAIAPPPAVVAQETVDLLLQELTDMGCRFSANLFEFLNEQHRQRVGCELLDYSSVVRERRPGNDTNSDITQTLADLLIDEVFEKMSSVAYRLVCEIICVKEREFRWAMTHANQLGLTEEVAKYTRMVDKYTKLKELYPCPENLSDD
jgi:hypothetical protein